MNKPNPEQLEQMLQATIRRPSPSFEKALREIPGRESGKVISWANFLKPLAVAATLILGLLLFLPEQSAPPGQPGPVLPGSLALDEEWIDLLSMAETLANAEVLADEDLLTALEHYAFHP